MQVTIQIPDGEQTWNVNGTDYYSAEAALNYAGSLVRTSTDVTIKTNPVPTLTVTLWDIANVVGKGEQYIEVFLNAPAWCAKNKIEGIKLVRQGTDLGLKEAKDAVETYQMVYVGTMTLGTARMFNQVAIQYGVDVPFLGRNVTSVPYYQPTLHQGDLGKAYTFETVIVGDSDTAGMPY